jgi:protein-S-isoprenylcysteine O-methyltransferase Ste14
MISLGLIPITPAQAIRWTWIAFVIYWAVSAAGSKKTKRKESPGERLAYTLPLLIGVFLMTTRKALSGWLGIRFVADADATRWFGAALTVAGVALAIWARKHIGTNWSGTVTLKEGHELIRTGPYARIRHPIYTGILLAGLGSAIEIGRIAGLVALALGWASFWVKARREESFLSEEFGPAFEVHQKQTGMFLTKLRR